MGKKFFATLPMTKAFGPNVTVWISLLFLSIENVTAVPGATFRFAGWNVNVSAFRLPGPMATTGPVAASAFLMRAFTVAVCAAASLVARARRFAVFVRIVLLRVRRAKARRGAWKSS